MELKLKTIRKHYNLALKWNVLRLKLCDTFNHFIRIR